MSRALEMLLSILDIEKLEENLFRGLSPQAGWQRVFGGQVIGQALVAAHRTVNGRPAHSLHAYFLRAGDPAVPIIYEVDRIRDGGSFSTRRVVAIQHGQAIFSMAASFHKPEEGLQHQMKMPEVPPPEALPSEAELKASLIDRVPPQVKAYWERERPIEIRPVDLRRYLSPENRAPSQQVWIRATGQARRRSRAASMRARLCLGLHPARYRADRPWPLRVRPAADAGEPRPRDLVSSEIQGRRLAALCPGQPDIRRRPRPFAAALCSPARASWWPRRPKKGWCGSATAE